MSFGEYTNEPRELRKLVFVRYFVFFVHESLPHCATQAVFQLGLDTILIIFTIYSLFFAGRIKLSSITDIVII